mgnify:FL=1
MTFPNSLDIIRKYAFYNCNNLTDIEFPSSLKEIRDCAFYATNINNLFIPKGVERIGYLTFSDCDSLEDITVESGDFKYVDISFSFEECTNLKRFEFKNKNAYVRFGGEVFSRDTNLETVVLHSHKKPERIYQRKS